MKVHVCPNGLLFLGFLVSVNEAHPQSRWVFEVGVTLPYNTPLPLLIRQSGQPDISLAASYSSRPFEIPICWIWRIGRWSGDAGWELQAIHHKLFLDNPPPEVDEFSISHGLNIVTVDRTWQLEEVCARIGAGITIAHPENSVRGLRLPENLGIFNMGYYVGGPALIAGAGRRFSLIGNFFLRCDGMVTASYSNVPVSSGTAYVWNVALHANFAVGYSLTVHARNTRPENE